MIGRPWRDATTKSDANRVAPLTASIPRLPWSPLRTRWLDVPTRTGVGQADPTWGGFSEVFARGLQALSRHVGRRVQDRASLEVVVTEVRVENPEVLVSSFARQEKLDLLVTAADRLIARRASADPGEADGCERKDRSVKVSDRAGNDA